VRYFFRVEYVGTAFCGWQVQPGGDSIQQQLQRTLSTVCREKITVTGAGRTDAGVHARRQGAHVDVSRPLDVRRVEQSVNALLPRDIAIAALAPVPDDFHARYSARRRRYRYRLTSVKSPLECGLAWFMSYPVDWKRIEREAAACIGTHEFDAFCAAGAGNDHCRCEVFHAGLFREGSRAIFTIEANRFIYKMVRSLVGTLVDIGRGVCTESLAAVIASRDRQRAGTTAPSCGLCLEDVVYDE